MRTVMVFGDSNTWGCPPFANIAQTPDRMARDERWAQVMGTVLGSGVWVLEEGLSGRTTVFDDPIEGLHKNGGRTLIPLLETHSPLDLVILMLGTNDFKDQFTISAFNSARGMLTLVQMIKGHYALVDRGPEILIVTPPSVSPAAEPAVWGDAHLRCRDHAHYLDQVAQRTGCFHFDSNGVVAAGIDGVHLDERSHRLLGEAMAREVRQILDLKEGPRMSFTS